MPIRALQLHAYVGLALLATYPSRFAPFEGDEPTSANTPGARPEWPWNVSSSDLYRSSAVNLCFHVD